jgi:DNA-binding transcriptional LysR family regulator
MAAASIAATTNLVATLPASLLPLCSRSLGLRALEGSVPVHRVELALCWHERTDADPATAEFRALVRSAILGTLTS